MLSKVHPRFITKSYHIPTSCINKFLFYIFMFKRVLHLTTGLTPN